MEYRAFFEPEPVCSGLHADSSVGVRPAARIAAVLIRASRFSVADAGQGCAALR